VLPWAGQNVFESEKVNWFTSFCLFDPVLMPLDPSIDTPSKEKFPCFNDIFSLQTRNVSLNMGTAKYQKEE
jgi:hypothetical protein